MKKKGKYKTRNRQQLGPYRAFISHNSYNKCQKSAILGLIIGFSKNNLANIFSEETIRTSIETKKIPYGNINLRDIKENAKDLINNFVKKYDKINQNNLFYY